MKSLCKICQKEFSSFFKLSHHCKQHNLSAKEYFDLYLKKENEGFCFKCRSITNFKSIEKGYEKYCPSKDCSMEKKKETCKRKYGTDFFFQTDEHKQKTEITNLKKYGVKSSNQSESIKNKITQRNRKIKEYENSVFIIEYANAKKASEILNIKYTTLNNILTGKTKKCKEYPNKFWIYVD